MSCGSWSAAPELREHAFERWDDPRHHHEDDREGDQKNRGRVDERALDLTLQFDALLDVDREALKDCVEDAAEFTGMHKVHKEVVEDFRVAAERLTERAALLDEPFDIFEDIVELFVPAGLARENVEALNKR